MAYTALTSLLQTLDHLLKCLRYVLDLKISESRFYIESRDDIQTVFPKFLRQSRDIQHYLISVRKVEFDEVRRVMRDLSLATQSTARVDECEIAEFMSLWCSNNFELSPRTAPARDEEAVMNVFQQGGVHHLNRGYRWSQYIRKLIRDCQKLKENARFIWGVFQQTRALYEDLRFLLTYLECSLNIPEDMLICVKEASKRAKDAIRNSIMPVKNQKPCFNRLKRKESIKEEITRKHGNVNDKVPIVPVKNHKPCSDRLKTKKLFFDGSLDYIRGALEQAREVIKSIKEEITGKLGNVNHKVPNLKSPFTLRGDLREDFLVDFDDEGLILERLITSDTHPGLDIVTIVGMGDIGKTSLAKKLFHHPYTVFHFDCRTWISVSQVYGVRDLLLGLLSCFAHKIDEITEKTNAELSEVVYRSLICKRYLIVIDDVWSINAWNDVKRCFPDDKTGSRIIVCSRFKDLSNHLSLKPPHSMNLFDTEKSWALLQKLLYRNGNLSSELEEVGRLIAKRCRGLPLAIVVIAGVLFSTPSILDSYVHIAENLGSIVATDAEKCLDILALSYLYLPHHLRSCFLYMGAFPGDCVIEVQKLINLWVAEGFLHSKSQENLEQIAEVYLGDLISRNLVIVEKRDFGGRVKTCRLHDFVKDVCLKEAVKGNFMNVVGRGNTENWFAGLRHQERLSFHLDPYSGVPAAIPLPHISSFLCFSLGSNTASEILFFQFEFKLLKVLDIYFLRFEYFPEQILGLVHLRYLALSVTFQLPQSFSLLRNLHTFVIQGPWLSPEFDSCPIFNMKYWIMPSLRHLYCSVPIELEDPLTYQEDSWPPCASKYIRTLSVLIFSSSKRRVFEIMPSLKRLQILETVDDYRSDALCHQLNNLVYLQELETLKCCFYLRNQELRRLSCLDAFPKTLKQLSLSWSHLPWEDMTAIARLPNLQVLKLKNYAFKGPKWRLAEESFPNLECLLIASTDLVNWDATVLQFPRLQKLVLKLCRNLEEIPFDIYAVGSLQHFEVHYCCSSVEVLAKDIQEQVEGVNVIIRTNLSQPSNAQAEYVSMNIDGRA